MLNIDVLFDVFWEDIPFEDRIGKIADCGYKYVETWQGGDLEVLKHVGEACQQNGVELVSIVMNFATDDAVAPVRGDRLGAFLQRIDEYSDNALAAGCSSGIVTSGRVFDDQTAEDHQKNLSEAIRKAGELAASKNFRLNLEPLNTLVDHAGYYLESRETGVEIIKNVALDNVKLLYDIYHMEIMTGNQVQFIKDNIDCIGHFHAAGVPGRHELFNGETHYPFVLAKIAEAGFDGFLGLEYMPELESGESLRKTLAYLG